MRWLWVAIVLAPLLVLSPSSHSADTQRGQLLYENHCRGCHDSRAHIRNDRRANTLNDVREWVTKWSSTLKLGWSKDERDDVAGYLYGRYYSAQ